MKFLPEIMGRATDDQIRFLASIYENIPSAIFVKDAQDNFRIKLWNRAAENIFEIPRAEILGKTAHDLWPKSEADVYLAADQKVADAGVELDIPCEASKTKTRGTIFLHTRKVPLRSFDCSSFRYVLCVCEDITRQHEFEVERAHLTRLLNEAQSTANIGSWDYDFATGALLWTSEHYRIFETVEPQPSDKLFELFQRRVHPDDLSHLMRHIQFARKSGHGFTHDFRLVFDDGRVKYIQGIARVIFSAVGVPDRLSGTCQDITQRIKTEEQLLQNSKLASLGQMAAGIAHEINNPLAIIQGTAEVLQRTLGDAGPSAEKLSSIVRASGRISCIVKGLLKYSRSSDRAEIGTHSLVTIVRETIDLAKPRIKECQAKTELLYDQDYFIECNEIEIGQVVLNLITNAVDAVKGQENPWIRLAIASIDNQAVLRVTDSGPGIALSDRKRIFDPFFTTKDVGKGTGLGLSISRGIAEAHHAEIRLLDDSLNTCFELRFLQLPTKGHEPMAESPQ